MWEGKSENQSVIILRYNLYVFVFFLLWIVASARLLGKDLDYRSEKRRVGADCLCHVLIQCGRQ